MWPWLRRSFARSPLLEACLRYRKLEGSALWRCPASPERALASGWVEAGPSLLAGLTSGVLAATALHSHSARADNIIIIIITRFSSHSRLGAFQQHFNRRLPILSVLTLPPPIILETNCIQVISHIIIPGLYGSPSRSLTINGAEHQL